MTQDLSDIPRHFIEEFKKAGPESVGWQIKAGGLSGPRLGYAVRWLTHLEKTRKIARTRHDQWLFRLAVATAILALIAAIDGGLQLVLG